LNFQAFDMSRYIPSARYFLITEYLRQSS
jgi:hypothetical protein